MTAQAYAAEIPAPATRAAPCLGMAVVAGLACWAALGSFVALLVA